MTIISLMKYMRKLPGGLLIYPMLLSALITTFAPNLLVIGSPTEDLFTSKSIMVLTGLILFIAGTQLELRILGKCLKKAGLLIVMKLLLAFAVSYIYKLLFGETGLFGLHVVALTAIVCSTNPGLYLAISSKKHDAIIYGIFALLSFIAIPAIPMLMIGAGSNVSIDYLPIISTLVPLFLGIGLRFVDPEFDKFFASGSVMLLPFLGFSFGTKLDLMKAASQFIPGIIGCVLFYSLIVLPMVLIERRFLKSNGATALSMNSVAGISLTVPILVLAESASDPMIAQLSVAIILTSLLTPLFVTKLISSVE